MSFKAIVRELKEIRDGIGNISRRRRGGGIVDGTNTRHFRRGKSHIAPDCSSSSSSTALLVVQIQQQSRWANLPPELLLDIIQRVEASETSWPARRDVVVCASVCRTWRDITKEIVKTPEQCSLLTFPISLKQVFFPK
jgi:tubby-related protein 1